MKAHEGAIGAMFGAKGANRGAWADVSCLPFF